MKTYCQLLLVGFVAALVTSCGKSEPRPAESPDAYLKRIQLVEGGSIESKDEEGNPTTFTIHQVSLVKDSGTKVQCKIGYAQTIGSIKGTGMKLQVFGSMWLDLKSSGGKWTWGKAMYVGESSFDRNQLEPPSGLISEAKADERGSLTREALKRAGITP